MKALTLRPDYAAYILHGLKHIETRSRSVGVHLKLPFDLVIHAGAEMKMVDRFRWRRLMRQYAEIAAVFETADHMYVEEPTHSAGLCIVSVTAIVPVTDVFDTLTPLEIAVGDYSYNPKNPRMAWKLENVRPFDQPIFAKGKQGLWTWKGTA